MNEKMQYTVDPDGKWIFRMGGLSGLIMGIGYLLTIPVTIYYAGGFPPSGVEARLAFFAEHAAGWWVGTASDGFYRPALCACLSGALSVIAFSKDEFMGLVPGALRLARLEGLDAHARALEKRSAQ